MEHRRGRLGVPDSAGGLQPGTGEANGFPAPTPLASSLSPQNQVRHMPAGGQVVNVASRGAFRGEPGQAAYGAGKAALVSMGQSLARALGPRQIPVTTVAPGWVETDMAAAALKGPGCEQRRNESPLGRVERR